MVSTATLRLGIVFLLFLLGSSVVAPVAAQVAPSERTYWPTAGWPTADPASQGMDPALLADANARIQTELPYLTSMLVVRGGDLVFEEYYNFAETDTVEIWSMTKSVTSTLVGIAVAEGLLTLDQTVGELIPDRIPATADSRAASVTVEQLLTMTSGFAWDSGTDYSFAFDEVDPTERALGLPIACDPGTCYEYNSGNVQVLSSIVQALSGMTLADYAQPRLFDPLGITRTVWRESIVGETLGAVGLSLTPRDLAKIGYLYLNNGVWDGAQIVPASWVEAATSLQSSGTNAAGLSLGPGAYGYLWWVVEIGGLPAYFALGVGSQLIYVVPALDLVVVATTTNAIPYEIPIEQQQRPRPVIEELIVPAVIGPVAVTTTEASPTAAQAAAPTAAPDAAATPAIAQLPAVQSPVSAATPAGSGRLFALPGERVFPEGIALQAETGDFYVGSVIDGTIYRGNLERGDVQAIPSDRPGTTAAGLALDDQGRLFVAGGQTGFVAVYDTSTGQRLVELGNGLEPNTFLNDIAVTAAGDAYITDSWNPILYRLPVSALPPLSASAGTPTVAPDALEIFLDLSTSPSDFVGAGYNANGIVATPDGRFLLIVQTNTGALYRIDLATQEVIQVDLGGSILTDGDGMTLSGQTLYVVTGEEITEVELSSDFASGTALARFSDPSFSSPTSIAHTNGCLLVVNSQFASIRGEPALPFTISSIPSPLSAGATPGAAVIC